MKKSLVLSLLIVISTLLCSCTKEIKKVEKQEISNSYTCQYRNRNRRFFIFLPENQNLSKTPLVVMLHGYGGSAQDFLRTTDFHTDAVPENYAVLYITGVPVPNVKTSSSGWNYFYDKNGSNDIRFIVDLTKYLQKQYKLAENAYVVGFSNGAFMATKLAVEFPEVYTGVVSVGGMMPDTVWNHRKKSCRKPDRFFQINGLKDDVTPMRLTDSAKYNPNPAMEDVVDYFVQINNASAQAVEEPVNELITITKYDDKVWWMLIKDYPHSWPSRRFCKINVNDYILEFLNKDAKGE